MVHRAGDLKLVSRRVLPPFGLWRISNTRSPVPYQIFPVPELMRVFISSLQMPLGVTSQYPPDLDPIA